MKKCATSGVARGQPHVVTMAISLVEFMFMKKGQHGRWLGLLERAGLVLAIPTGTGPTPLQMASGDF
jgi:hypothetical protein